MITFHSDLVIKAVPYTDDAGYLYEDTTVWEVVDYFTVQWYARWIQVPPHFKTDLASIPRIAWRICPPGHKYVRKASVAHDYLYARMWRSWTKEDADLMFYDAMLASGMPKFKAWMFYQCVRWFGKGGWR